MITYAGLKNEQFVPIVCKRKLLMAEEPVLPVGGLMKQGLHLHCLFVTLEILLRDNQCFQRSKTELLILPLQDYNRS